MQEPTFSPSKIIPLHDDTAGGHAPHARPQAKPAALGANASATRGFWRILAALFARIFTPRHKKEAPKMQIVAGDDRAATAIAARMDPPMAFKGDTASTLVTPISAYAGKPVEQAIRKRAEQQFKNLDVTTATMN